MKKETIEGMKYSGMSIFQEAKQRKVEGTGYRARRFRIIWQNKLCNWNWLAFEYGIRWSDKWQIFPIWNTSNNSSRSLTFGLWKLYFEVIYNREMSFNQHRKLFLRKQLWKFYQLFN